MNKKIKIGLAIISLLVLLNVSALRVLSFSYAYGPTALVVVNNSMGDTSTEFLFDAGQSTDSGGNTMGLNYRFNYEFGNTDFTEWQISPIGKYTYATKGIKTVLVEVRDLEGRIDRVTLQVTVEKTSGLRGQLSVDKYEGDMETEFNFFVTMFTGGGESTGKFRFRWDFDGDGVYDTDFGNAAAESHIYSTSGTKTPIVEVKDDSDNTLKLVGYKTDSNEIGRIKVTSSRMPRAAVTVFPSSGEAGITKFYLDSSLSRDETGSSNVEVRYDFENDGSFDTSYSTDKKTTYVFKTGGEKEVLVQVRSSSGKTDSAIAKVTLYEKDSKPYAKFRITNNGISGDNYSGTVSTTFSFDASESKDLEDFGSDLEARWDFDGDGNYDTVFSNVKFVKHKYLSVGEKNITLEIKDSQGNRATANGKVFIVSNEPPTVILKTSPLSGPPSTKFKFDIMDSHDSQNQSAYLQARIDYEGDGIYDSTFSPAKIFYHTYNKKGEYKPVVQVKDKFGQTNNYMGTIIVFDSTDPIPFFTVEPQEGTFITNFTFDASQSNDAETPLRDLKFRWDYNYTGANDIIYDTSFSPSTKSFHLFKGDTGERRIRLEVEDEEGNRQSTVKSVYLHWASPYLQKLYQRGILTGSYKEGLRPDEFITRAELVKIVVKAAKLDQTYKPFQGYFRDVKSTDWFWTYVERAKDAELITGYEEEKFGPERLVNRAEALKIILLAFREPLIHNCSDVFNDMDNSEWFARYVCTSYRLGIIKGYGDGKFHAERNITRAEASKIVSLLMD